MGIRRLPEHLEFVMHDGEMIHGTGPYTVFLLDKQTGKKHRLILRSPEGGTVAEFMTEFERALKDQLGVSLKPADPTERKAGPKRENPKC